MNEFVMYRVARAAIRRALKHAGVEREYVYHTGVNRMVGQGQLRDPGRFVQVHLDIRMKSAYIEPADVFEDVLARAEKKLKSVLTTAVEA